MVESNSVSNHMSKLTNQMTEKREFDLIITCMTADKIG